MVNPFRPHFKRSKPWMATSGREFGIPHIDGGARGPSHWHVGPATLQT